MFPLMQPLQNLKHLKYCFPGMTGARTVATTGRAAGTTGATTGTTGGAAGTTGTRGGTTTGDTSEYRKRTFVLLKLI